MHGYFNPFDSTGKLDIRVKDGIIQWRYIPTNSKDEEHGWNDMVSIEELKSLGNIIEKFEFKTDKWIEKDNELLYELTSRRIYKDNLVTVGLQLGVTKEQYEAIANAKIAAKSQGQGKIVLQAFGEKPTIDIPAFMLFADLAEELPKPSTDIVIIDKETNDVYEIYISNEKVHIREIEDTEENSDQQGGE